MLNKSFQNNHSDHKGAIHRLPYSHTNGHSFHPSVHHDSSGLSDERSAEEDSTEDEDDDEDEAKDYTPKWKGIEAIVEAYQKYTDGKLEIHIMKYSGKYSFIIVVLTDVFGLERSIESEVLQSECRRLETQHYHLTLTADQLSLSMGVRFSLSFNWCNLCAKKIYLLIDF